MMNIIICFTVASIFLTEGTSVKVHPGGNVTLPCTAKDDQEISWIITNGNQTFVRILRVEYGDGEDAKPNHYNMHPDYEGRIRPVSSFTNTHSLFLMNITSTDLMLYCCMNFNLEQTNCTKLDFEELYESGNESVKGEDQQERENHEKERCGLVLQPFLLALCVLLFLSMVSHACVCWRRKMNRKEKLRSSSKKSNRNKVEQVDEPGEISYASIKITKDRKKRGEYQFTQDTVYARIK